VKRSACVSERVRWTELVWCDLKGACCVAAVWFKEVKHDLKS